MRTWFKSPAAVLSRWIIEQAGEKRPREIPLKICAYQKCQRFFVPKRIDAARFCTDRICRIRAANEAKPLKEKSAYMHDYRVKQRALQLAKLDPQKQIEIVSKMRDSKFRTALEKKVREEMSK